MFTIEEQPILIPVGAAECQLNNQQLLNLWNYLRCLSSQVFYGEKKCYNFWTGDQLTTFEVPKSEVPIQPDPCEINFMIISNLDNSVKKFCPTSELAGASVEYTLDIDDPDNWIFELSTPPTTNETVRIEILIHKHFDELFVCDPL